MQHLNTVFNCTVRTHYVNKMHLLLNASQFSTPFIDDMLFYPQIWE